MTYLQSGFCDFSVRSVIVIDMPVANGRTIKSLIKLMPQSFFITCKHIALVILTIRLDPIALG